ncbi:MAG TPA: response regulator transcription factor [Terracidiphilus sp.]|jgi:two-component system response regulator PhoP
MRLLEGAGEEPVRVLVVDDEMRLAQNMAAALREGPNYAVDICHDGQEALLLCDVTTYDLVILDLMLPKLSGHEVLRRIRASNAEIPVLVLTAVSGPESTIELLNLGADDYMTKPFDLGELIARARALIRRGKGLKNTTLRVGPVAMSIAEQRVSVSGKDIDLSPTEYRILEYLMHHPRAVVSKERLLEHLYDFTWEHHSNVIEAHISNLRRKMRNASELALVETLRGRGYRLAVMDEALR